MKHKLLTVRVTEACWNKLDKKAKSKGKVLSDYVRDAIILKYSFDEFDVDVQFYTDLEGIIEQVEGLKQSLEDIGKTWRNLDKD